MGNRAAKHLKRLSFPAKKRAATEERKTWPKEGANCINLLDVSHSPTKCKYHSGRILILMIVSIQRNHFFHMGFWKFINELIVALL